MSAAPHPPDRLVAVTATGAIYRGDAEVAILPMSVGLGLIQELALRGLHPEAAVCSSMAARPQGVEALRAWGHVCTWPVT